MANKQTAVLLPEQDDFNFGVILRDEREKKGIDLKTVAQDLRISTRYLRALEEDPQSLVCDVYTSGFLRSYAQYLGLDGEPFLIAFKKTSLPVVEQPDLTFTAVVPHRGVPKPVYVVISAVILCIVALYWGWKYERTAIPDKLSIVDNSIRQIESSNPQTLSPQAQSKPTLYPDPTTSSDSKYPLTPLISPQLSLSPQADNQSSETPAAKQEKEELVAKTPPHQGNENTEDVDDTKSATKNSTAPLPVLEAQNNNQNMNAITVPHSEKTDSLTIKATEESWLEITNLDGEVVFSKVLYPGQQYHLENPQNFLMDTGNAGGLQLALGDKIIPSLGGHGQVRKEVSLNPEKLLAEPNNSH